MIGQLPPFAIATPTFRFRALAAQAGRASLGGDREIALACFTMARLAAGTLPPVMLAPGDAAARCAAVRQWLASLALPNGPRAAATAAVDAIASGKRRASADSLRALATVSAAQLDHASVSELGELADELGVGSTPHEPRTTMRDHGRS